MLIYLSMHILTKFTHKQHVIHFSNNNTQKWPKYRTHIKQGTSWSLHGLSPNYWDTKTHHKPKDISLGIKTKPQYNPRLPENSPKNPVRTVSKQSRKFSPNCPKTVLKFSPDCPKTIPKIPKNSYTQYKKLGTEIYGI